MTTFTIDTAKTKFIKPMDRYEGFGALDAFGEHIFRADVSASTGDVTITEDYGIRGGERGVWSQKMNIPKPIAKLAARAFFVLVPSVITGLLLSSLDRSFVVGAFSGLLALVYGFAAASETPEEASHDPL